MFTLIENFSSLMSRPPATERQRRLVAKAWRDLADVIERGGTGEERKQALDGLLCPVKLFQGQKVSFLVIYRAMIAGPVEAGLAGYLRDSAKRLDPPKPLPAPTQARKVKLVRERAGSSKKRR